MATDGNVAPNAGPIRLSTFGSLPAPPSGGDHKRIATTVIGAAGAALAFCAFVLFVVTLLLRRRRCSSAEKVLPRKAWLDKKRSILPCSNVVINSAGKRLNDTLSQTPKKHIHFPIDQLSIATSGFDEVNLVGEGGFGKVFRGVLAIPPFSKVAIKVLTESSSQGVKEFITEIEVLSRLDHKHLVRLLGSCMVGDQLLLVYRHITNGSLSDHLYGEHRPTRTNFPWATRVKIALGAALGIQHLHLQQPPVLHRDIKAANILLTKNFNAKVCDFGFAKQLSGALDDAMRFCCTPSRSGAIGTLGYVAPESMMTGEVSSASDVYSFGVVLLELLTGRKPLDFTKPEKDQSLLSWARTLLELEKVEELIDPSMPEELSRIRESVLLFVRMTRLCLDMESRVRPTMGEVVQTLQVIKLEHESRPDCVTINLSDSDSSSENSGDKSPIKSPGIIPNRFDDRNCLDWDHFSKRFLEGSEEGDEVYKGDLSKSDKRCSSSGRFTRPLSWLSFGLTHKPSTPARG